MDWKIPEFHFPFVLPERYIIPVGEIELTRPYLFLLLVCAIVLIIRFALKVIFKKAEHMQRALSISMNIVLIYCIFALCHTFNPLGIQEYLGRLTLPFIRFEDDKLLFLFSIHDTFPEVCTQILCMIFLAFLVSQVFEFKPGNVTPLGLKCARLIAALFFIGVYYGAYRVMMKLVSYIPDYFLPYLPIGALCVLAVLYILGWLKRVMVKMLVTLNPTFEGLSGFFFTNRFGKHVTRAMYTTFFLTLLTIGFEWAQISELSISPAGLWDGILILVSVLILWGTVGTM